VTKVPTNIEIEDDYVQAIMRRYHLRTKAEVVHLARRRLAAEPTTRDEALAMRGSHSIGEIPEDQSVALRHEAAVLAHDADIARIADIMPLQLDKASLRVQR